MKFKDWFIKQESKKINEQYGRDCDYCGGSGQDPDYSNRYCPECNGQGIVYDDEGGGGGDWYRDEGGRREPKKEKIQKVFKIGDVLKLVDKKQSSKMPPDAYDFLMTYDTFTVKSINEKGKINLGCRISKNENGKGVEKIYMFSTDRFELVEPKIDTTAKITPPVQPLN